MRQYIFPDKIVKTLYAIYISWQNRENIIFMIRNSVHKEFSALGTLLLRNFVIRNFVPVPLARARWGNWESTLNGTVKNYACHFPSLIKRKSCNWILHAIGILAKSVFPVFFWTFVFQLSKDLSTLCVYPFWGVNFLSQIPIVIRIANQKTKRRWKTFKGSHGMWGQRNFL
jgi:hypothetical protein